MFESATLKLTAWYLSILMSISLIFSFVIYQLNFNEVGDRLQDFQQVIIDRQALPPIGYPALTDNEWRNIIQAQSDKAALQMIMYLIYLNAAILVGGGIGSYFLARRTLRPIQQVHEAQTRFTSDASHELRTPLATMKLQLESGLRSKTLPQKEARLLLESNLEEVNKLISLSEMLLKLSRLDFDRLEKSSVNISKLASDVINSFSKTARNIQSNLSKRTTTYANKIAIQELLHILIENAVKYSPSGSPITVDVATKTRNIVITVTNQGKISKANLPHIFDRFYRADNARTNSSKNGYGLGLALAKKIVDIHGGNITASSSRGTVKLTALIPVIRRPQTKPNNHR